MIIVIIIIKKIKATTVFIIFVTLRDHMCFVYEKIPNNHNHGNGMTLAMNIIVIVW